MTHILGIDVAGVIMNVPTRITQVEFNAVKNSLRSVKPTAPFSTIRRVVEMFDEIYLISAAGDSEIEEKTREWLDVWNFWDITGISASNLIFTGMEASAKADICKKIGLVPNVFIDDRPEVLAALEGLVRIRIFFDRGEGEIAPTESIRVSSWGEIESYLREG